MQLKHEIMILLTGATGLVGSHVLYDLTSDQQHVRVLKRKTSSTSILKNLFAIYSNNPEELLGRIEWVDGDVQDYFSVEEAMQGIDQVYHCAAMVSFDPKDQPLMMKINVGGSANVVNACLASQVKKLCFVSSVAALGRSGQDVMVDETCDWIDSKENSEYAKSKYAAEREVWRGIAEGLDAVIVNPSIIIGPGDPGKSSVRLLKMASKGNPFYTEGINSFVDVRDVSRAMIELMQSNLVNERFVLAGGNYSYRHLFNLMADGFGLKRPSIHVKPWIFEILWRAEKLRSQMTGSSALISRETAGTSSRRYYYSSEKIQKALNFEFTPIERSIIDNCKYFAALQNLRK